MKLKPTAAAPLLLMGVFALTVVFKLLPFEVFGENANPYLAAVIIQLVIFAVPALLFCTLRGGDYTSNLRVRLPRPSSAVLTICAVIVMICGSAVINYLMSFVSPEMMAEGSASSYAGFAMNAGVFDALYLVLVFALLPAVTEEFLFRGIILHEYSTLSVSCSVIVSSLMFAMCHFSFVRLPAYFLCGLVLAALTYAARSVIASVIAHTVYNISTLFFEDYILHLAEKNNISSVLFVIVMAVLAMAALAFASFEASSIYKGYAVDNVESDHVQRKHKGIFTTLTSSFFSPAFLFAAVFYILMTIIM